MGTSANPINQYNYFIKVTASGTAFPTTPQISVYIPYVQGFLIGNEGSNVIQYSFDGITVHGDLTPNSPTDSLLFANRPCSALWLCVPGGGSSLCRFEAWSRS
jgi:hypothetical protein